MDTLSGLQLTLSVGSCIGVAGILIRIGRFIEKLEEIEKRVNRLECSVWPTPAPGRGRSGAD